MVMNNMLMMSAGRTQTKQMMEDMVSMKEDTVSMPMEIRYPGKGYVYVCTHVEVLCLFTSVGALEAGRVVEISCSFADLCKGFLFIISDPLFR
jgi:hypothetical protein